MVINTLNSATLISSLADIFNIESNSLVERVRKYGLDVVENNYNEDSIQYLHCSNLFNGNLDDYADRVRGIVFHHMCQSDFLSDYTEIHPLAILLTTPNEFSSHLKSKGVTFDFDGSKIWMKKNGKLVDFEKSKNEIVKYSLLQRFGHTTKDFNVNGYLFRNCFKESDCKNWLRSPELLTDIAEFFGESSIEIDYVKDKVPCLISAYVPITAIDCISGISRPMEKTKNEKSLTLLKFSVNALCHELCCSSKMKDYENPVICLTQHYSVPKLNFREKRKIKRYDWQYLVVE